MRDLTKTLTYGGMHLVVAMAVAYAVSGSWAIALGIGLIEPLVQTIFYNLHERAWRFWPRRRPVEPAVEQSVQQAVGEAAPAA